MQAGAKRKAEGEVEPEVPKKKKKKKKKAADDEAEEPVSSEYVLLSKALIYISGSQTRGQRGRKCFS